MSKTRKKWIERGKSLLIVLLTCSAIFLLLRTQQDINGNSRENGWIARVQALLSGGGSGGNDMVLLTETVRPVRMAVTTEQGRYGVQYDDEKLDELFAAVNPLLTESMAACGQARRGQESGWRDALTGPGIYFDFLGSVPLEALSATGNGEGGHSARRVILSAGAAGAVLWYWETEENAPYFCALTETLREQLEQTLEQYAGHDGSFFAFEREEYSTLDSWQLMTPQEYTSRIYQVANPLVSNSDLRDELVQTAGFNPHSLYTVNGEWVVKDGAATLRIRPDGTVTYTDSQTDGNPRLSVAVSGASATRAEAVEGARELLEQTLGQVQSAARFYLISCTPQDDESIEVRFGYLLEGAEVRLGGGEACADIVVSGRRIRSFTLRYRSYTATEDTSAVLPVRQAAAAMAALEPAGGELLLCYPDDGSEGTVQATWSVRRAEH